MNMRARRPHRLVTGVPKLYSSNAVHVARGTSYIVIQGMTNSAAMVVSFAVLARLITPKEMGILGVLQLVNGSCQIIATLALPQAATKSIAEHSGRGEKHVSASVFYQVLRTTLILAVSLGLIVLLSATVLSIQLLREPTYAILFQLLAFDIPVYGAVLPVLAGAMLGLQKFKQTAVIGIVNTLVRQSLIIILIIAMRSFVGLVVAWLTSDLITSSICMAYILRTLGPPRFEFRLRELLKFSWPLCLIDAVTFASTWFDRAVLLMFVPLATLGVYNATITAFNVLANIAVAMGKTLLPAYSAMQSSHQRQTLSDAIRMASRYASIVAVPLALGLLATADPALTLFVGPGYIEGTKPLMILAATFAFTIVGTVLSPMLLALGETRVASAITLVSVVTSLVVAFILLPLWGIVGAAVARGLAMVLTTALTFMFLSRKVRLELDLEAICKSLIVGAVMAVVVLGMQTLMYSRYLLPLYVLVGALTYFASLRILHVIKPSDLEFTTRYLGPRFGSVQGLLERYLVPREMRN